jgi:hypothetical protein
MPHLLADGVDRVDTIGVEPDQGLSQHQKKSVCSG